VLPATQQSRNIVISMCDKNVANFTPDRALNCVWIVGPTRFVLVGHLGVVVLVRQSKQTEQRDHSTL
jgi:hypothetical protein